jgi:hypothetical protein
MSLLFLVLVALFPVRLVDNELQKLNTRTPTLVCESEPSYGKLEQKQETASRMLLTGTLWLRNIRPVMEGP